MHRSRIVVFSALAGLAGGLVLAGGNVRAAPVQAAASPIQNERDGCRNAAFRVRGIVKPDLNDDAGWAGAPDEAVAVDADAPFRLRMALEHADAGNLPTRFWLQVRRNDGPWTDLDAADFPYPLAAPPVSVVSSKAFRHGEATRPLLAPRTADFVGGSSVMDEAVTALWVERAGYSEWEWPLVIRRFADQTITNDHGDVFGFRMVDLRGACVAGTLPSVRLRVPDFHLGGTFVETPGSIGPWQAGNGDLYFIMEPAETSNVMMMVKSSDGGRSWAEVDPDNRPVEDDLEGVSTVFVDGTIHILHQPRAVFHHAFNTSDHPTRPDRWVVRDAPVAAPGKPWVQVIALADRPDGSLLGVYGAPQDIRYKVRSADGHWGEETVIEAGSGQRLSGPMAVTGSDGVVHLAYTGGDGMLWYRRIGMDGRAGEAVHLASGLASSEADAGSVLPLVYQPESDTVIAIYRVADGRLWERTIVAGIPTGPARRVSGHVVIQNAVDSDQTGADAIGFDGTVQLLFIEKDSGSLFHASRYRDGRWSVPRMIRDKVDAQWVRGQVVRKPDGHQVYGFVYDAGSDGGSGMNRYGEVELGSTVPR